ncbi:UDP-phosphate alpha N-acetylglucosaminyltransferase [Roseibium aggregatum]|uniref:UDP-phosphate alpha N-acetylglucosaminyltransferase n=1 Tax=Roseibium aggregatum TaxID=187304 RepID=A0A939J2M5_9HYPH|nr:UDP-phosphate alpha N-acetylglucosaminyltransferase [Roseibium aggregatum]MBN9668759.1 UDP-phosphate alpha N-acetylglucosaminyltransferase [Roseibium aggregatum]
MLSSSPPDRFGPRGLGIGRPDAAIDRDRYRLWLFAIYAVAVGTLTFNFFLAFTNTNLFRISETHVILGEMLLLGIALPLALSRDAALYVILFLYFSFMAFILALRPELDLKAIRDFLIPIVFYFVGKKFRTIEDADRLIWIATFVVIFVGLFEFIFLDIYTRVIDIFQYYVARGTLAADSNFVEGSNLFISSTRIGGRNFFGFLGNLRASSVFLEPVTMGNFGAFLCLWALFRAGMRHRAWLFAAGFVAIVLPDARFGMFVCVALFVAAPAAFIVPRILWWSVPLMITFALAIYGAWTSQIIWNDNFTGRLLHASQLIQEITPDSFFGILAYGPELADNGFAYSIVQIGAVGLLALWTLFVFAPYQNPRAIQFKALAITYISLLMTVSNSFYSIKLAALFWIVAGAADAMKLPDKAPGNPAPSEAAPNAPMPDRVL